MGQLQLKTIPLTELHVSKLNMRHGRKKPDISDILPSIREHGVRQTLLVRLEGNGYGVIAGRRRFFAVQEVAKETGKPGKIPCALLRESDDAIAVEASLLENVARLPASEMEQFTAFKRLSDEGRSVDDIGTQFGVTELYVRRVLALASLIAPIRRLYDQEKIDVRTIRALTLASEDQQAEWMTLYKSHDEHAPTGQQCKAWITGGNTITTDKALFDLETYEGQVIGDLFGECGVFADTDTFWKHQSVAIAEQVEAFKEAGWSDVIVLERGQYFQSWDYAKRARTKGGKVIIEIRHDGSVTIHEGYLSKSAIAKQVKAKQGKSEDSAIKPELSGPLTEYVNLHRHGAARASLLKDPGIALRLMLAHAMADSPLWTIRSHNHVSRKDTTEASLEASRAEAEMTEAQAKVADLLTTHGACPSIKRNGDSYGLCQLFAAFLTMEDADILQILAFVMADTLAHGDATVEAVLYACDTPVEAYWKPEPGLLALARDKRLVNAMLGDVAGDSVAASMLTETAKAQRTAIGNRIIGEGCKPNPDWRPAFMAVPPTRYLPKAASSPADNWNRIESLFHPKAAEADTAPDLQDAA